MSDRDQNASSLKKNGEPANDQGHEALGTTTATELLANLSTLSGRTKVSQLATAHAESFGSQGSIIMPLFSNAKFVPFLRNLLCSIERLAVNAWFAIGLDNHTCVELNQHGSRRCVHPYDASAATLSEQRAVFGSQSFFLLALQRPLWVHHLLSLGLTVLNCDLDIVWLHNPIPFLSPIRNHLIIQSDTGHGLNSGFYLARPASISKQLFGAWLTDLAKRAAGHGTANEQDSLNSVLRHTATGAHVRPHVLNETLFPNGKMWWEWGKSDKQTAFIVHCNWARYSKKARLVRDNLWFLEKGDARCADGFDPRRADCDRRCLPYQSCDAEGRGECKLITSCATLRTWHAMARAAANCSDR